MNDSNKRYRTFLKDVLDGKGVHFHISNDSNLALTPSDKFAHLKSQESSPILPLWTDSHISDAATYIDEEDQDSFTLHHISFEDFVNFFVKDKLYEELIFGFNWDKSLTGCEYTYTQFEEHLALLQEGGTLPDDALEEQSDEFHMLYEDLDDESAGNDN